MQKLTFKQTAFIKYYMETGNGTEACRQAGYKGNDQTLAVVANQNLSKLYILDAIGELKKQAGLTPERLLKKHLELLNANKIQGAQVFVQLQADGTYKVNESKNDFIEVPDRSIQLGALRLAYEVEGRLLKKIKESDVPVEEELEFAGVPKQGEGNGKFKRFYN